MTASLFFLEHYASWYKLSNDIDYLTSTLSASLFNMRHTLYGNLSPQSIGNDQNAKDAIFSILRHCSEK